MASATRAATHVNIDEFQTRYADVPFCELERGEVIQLTTGGWKHSSICSRVTRILGNWAEQTGLGRVLTGEAGIITSRNPDTVRGVDVAYFSFDRVPRGKEPEAFSEIAPTLAVEVVGKGQGWKKMTEKAAEYLRMGADRVWVIDPQRNTLHVFTSDAPPREFGVADTIENDPALPGFTCRVAEIFAE